MIIPHCFKVGDRVLIINHERYVRESLIGLYGTVRLIHNNNHGRIGVTVDGTHNNYSSYGYYYFEPAELELLNENATNDQEETNMNYITNYLNIAKIKFVDEKYNNTYEYANFCEDLKVGDFCVVMSAHHGLGLAKVVEIIDSNGLQTMREVVAKVYTNDYDERVEQRAKAEDLKNKMQERAKKLQDIALYQMLAKDDPDMAYLLKEYQAVTGM